MSDGMVKSCARPDHDPKSGVTGDHLVHDHIGWMYSVALRILRDESLAEDAVQNAFSKVFQKRDSFEGRSSLKTWMHRITVNEALMLLRKIRTRNELAVDHMAPAFDQHGLRIAQRSEPSQTAEDQLQSLQIGHIVRQHIADLPGPYRVIITLRDIEGLSISDISAQLELSETNAKVRLHRARCALKKRLAPIAGGLMA